MPFMTTERARALRVPVKGVDGEPLALPTCAEAQADGVPCDTVHADCECCARALAREAAPEGPE
jgi:hypothetical protein